MREQPYSVRRTRQAVISRLEAHYIPHRVVNPRLIAVRITGKPADQAFRNTEQRLEIRPGTTREKTLASIISRGEVPHFGKVIVLPAKHVIDRVLQVPVPREVHIHFPPMERTVSKPRRRT